EGESRRVTFLINIWLNHRPCGVLPLSDEEVARTLSPASSAAELTALASSVRLSPSPASSTATVRKFGKRISLPFLSRSATWEKEEGESGLLLSMCLPKTGADVLQGVDTLVMHLDPRSGHEAFLVQEDEEAFVCRKCDKLRQHSKSVLKRPASAKARQKRR
ncbi:unnamed protein product, partial [Polarella glacialis]